MSDHVHTSTGELHATVARRLEHVGQRYTSGRRQIVELLGKSAHPLTIPEIIAVDESLKQSSVYRNLAVLEGADVVARVITNGEWTRVELAEDLTGHHHHLICDACGAVRDIEVPAEIESALDAALVGLAEREGFTLDRHRLDLVGRCAECGPAA